MVQERWVFEDFCPSPGGGKNKEGESQQMGRATRRRPRPTGFLNAGVFQGHRPPLTTPSRSCGYFLGGRTLSAPGPSLIISLPAFASFLWYARRTPYSMPASLSRSDCSMVVLGPAAPTEPTSSSKATQRERSTGRYHFTAMRRASSLFIFSHLLGFGSADRENSRSRSATLIN